MIRISLALCLTLTASGAAFAHVGHVSEQAGHNHLAGFAALGAAAVLALWIGSRKRRAAERADRSAASDGPSAEA